MPNILTRRGHLDIESHRENTTWTRKWPSVGQGSGTWKRFSETVLRRKPPCQHLDLEFQSLELSHYIPIASVTQLVIPSKLIQSMSHLRWLSKCAEGGLNRRKKKKSQVPNPRPHQTGQVPFIHLMPISLFPGQVLLLTSPTLLCLSLKNWWTLTHHCQQSIFLNQSSFLITHLHYLLT